MIGLVISIIAAVCAVIAGGALLGILLVRLIRYSRGGGVPGVSFFGTALGTLGRLLMLLLLVVMLIIVFGPVGAIFCGVLVFAGIECFRKYRASQQNALLWLLVISAERSMPLGPAIEAFAAEQGGSFAWRARRLAELLAAGTPLPDALELCPRLLPVYTLPMIRVGSQSGALAPALRQAATVHDQNAPLFMSMIGKISYLLLLPVFGVAILVFVMAWIVPKFTMIFHDFAMDLPSMTSSLILLSYFFVNYWYLFLPLFLFFAWLLAYAPMRYFGWTLWDLPLARRLARRLDSARILDGLALAAGQRRPLGEGIAALAISYPKPDVRRRLALAVFDIEAGCDWSDSLARYGLIRQADHALLQAAQRTGNLPWAMQEMADSARRRFFYKLQAIVQAVFPVVLIGFGLVVMFIVVALFWPLVTLIQKVA
jgi:type II secretory pathway component PulF